MPQDDLVTTLQDRGRALVHQIMTVDLPEVQRRVLVRQLTKLVRDALSALFMRGLGDDSAEMRGKVGRMLQTPLGAALVQGWLYALAEGLGADEGLALEIKRELRISALFEVGDVVAELIRKPLQQVREKFPDLGAPAPKTESVEVSQPEFVGVPC